VAGIWEPYARASESTVAGELLVHRGLERELLVLLPPGYGGGRYPVLYAQDGQNLFDSATHYSGDWLVDESMAALAGEGIEAIVVGIPSAPETRVNDYCPWPEVPHVSACRADQYLDFLLGPVRSLVDGSFATDGRAGVLGSSLGALVSLYGFCSRPGAFEFAGALSIAVWGGERAFGFFEHAPRVDGRIWVDAGDREAPDDPQVNDWYVDSFRRLAVLLEQKGYGEDLHAELVPGGVHHESAWAERFPDVMRFWLGRP
jgi:predicted alpha/beta superfamily hydrolase